MGIHSSALIHKKDFKEYFVELLMLFITGKINQLDILLPHFNNSISSPFGKTNNKKTGSKKIIRLIE